MAGLLSSLKVRSPIFISGASAGANAAASASSGPSDLPSGTQVADNVFSPQTIKDCGIGTITSSGTAPGIVGAAGKCIGDGIQDLTGGPGPSPTPVPSST